MNISQSPLGLQTEFGKKFQSAATDGKLSEQEITDIKTTLANSGLSQPEQDNVLKVLDKLQKSTKLSFLKSEDLESSEFKELQQTVKDMNSPAADALLDLVQQEFPVQKDQNLLKCLCEGIGKLFEKPSNQPGSTNPQDSLQGPHTTGPLSEANFGPSGVQMPTIQSPTTQAGTPQMDFTDFGDDDAPMTSGQTTPASTSTGPCLPSTPGSATDVTYQRSPYHDPNLFVPKFGMTAFHESGVYRRENDPYAVGAISRPNRGQDLGGKTYGAYQFESSVYANGSTAGRDKVQNSTLMRFVNSPNNPFGAELQAAARQHGPASEQFDAVWTRLAQQSNKAFGEAQEAFLLQERQTQVNTFMETAQLDPEVRQDPRIIDLIMGTTNQLGGLADGVAEHLARVQAQRGRKLTADEVGCALVDYKKSRIGSLFASSPGAQQGIRDRYIAERNQFVFA